jgi:hypothetical protein
LFHQLKANILALLLYPLAHQIVQTVQQNKLPSLNPIEVNFGKQHWTRIFQVVFNANQSLLFSLWPS